MVEERFTGNAESISADDLELVAEITSKIVQQDIADKEVRKIKIRFIKRRDSSSRSNSKEHTTHKSNYSI